ncbi:uncharacterized protein BBA_06075 [Beauveria bassiana ARSEF 2860]|uniref:Aminoglycoside phosphotransferase domain-containing protein n=1 Tax=Beauveria bassiana (strain ARSEF 2860) TaxID=655819 RepID=J4W397_BEAB2|nr:uncharacterized protein BBA_06075 [Beauveria bassiana ARSEF 2860]EJP64900.1 hypothetical protein BBA_06075 [Beauveria bassiana ARSEF 2860]
MLSSASTNRIMIDLFFRERPMPSQKDCDEFARALTQCEPDLALMQGANSYTVRAGHSYIVQFRKPSRRLDLALLRLAREVYGAHVPEFVEVHRFGNLWVYKITQMQGIPVYTLRTNPTGDVCKSPFCRTVQDYARFCAASWKHRPSSPPRARATLQIEYLAALEKLSHALPDRFGADVERAREAVWRLFGGDWPMVVNNPQVTRSNVHVADDESGALLGLVAWGTAEVGPWGMMVPGIETLLGHMSYGGTWTRVDGYATLRRLFYDELGRELGGLEDERLDGVYALGLLLQKTPHSLGSCWETLEEGVLSDDHPAVTFLQSALLDWK